MRLLTKELKFNRDFQNLKTEEIQNEPNYFCHTLQKRGKDNCTLVEIKIYACC